MPEIFVFAGEMSGDLYAGNILRKLAMKLPDYQFWGVGGPSMRNQAFTSILPMESFQVMGITDVIMAFPRLLACFRKLKKEILAKNPEMVVFVDSPSFGMRLAKALRKAGYRGKIAQVVAPTVWAWRPDRADEMAKYFDLLLTIFDFEPAYFAHTSLKTVFVGHPIIEHIQESSVKRDKPILAIFPGSRPAEVKRNLKKQLAAADAFCKNHPEYEIAICSPCLDMVPFKERYSLMQRAHLALAKSGTVNLELALYGVPTVVTYELSWLNTFMAKHVMKLKLAYFSIVNILSQKELFFERIKPPVTTDNILQCLEAYHQDPRLCDQIRAECLLLKERLMTDRLPTDKITQELCELIQAEKEKKAHASIEDILL